MPRYLVIQLRQLGDILLTTPVLRALRQYNPDADITFMTHAMGRLCVRTGAYLDTHLVYPQTSIWDELEFFTSLRREKFDVVFDFMANPRSALLSLATQAPMRVSFASSRRLAYTHVIPRDSGKDYIVMEKMRMLQHVGMAPNVSTIDQRMVFDWSEEDYHAVKDYLAILNGPRVVLSPTHRRSDRKWPGTCWIKLAQALVAWNPSIDIIWAWGPGEYEEVETLAKGSWPQDRLRVERSLPPKTTLREQAALFANCDLVIANSNGPSHVAVAVNTPSLQLHGPTEAPSWCPLTERHQGLVGQTKSIEAISVNEVVCTSQKMLTMITGDSKRSLTYRQIFTSASQLEKQRPVLTALG